jgi:hypothetical protein
MQHVQRLKSRRLRVVALALLLVGLVSVAVQNFTMAPPPAATPLRLLQTQQAPATPADASTATSASINTTTPNEPAHPGPASGPGSASGTQLQR